MRDMDLHFHSPTACVRGDGTLDPLRGVCVCGKYFEADPYRFKRREVKVEYINNIMTAYVYEEID
jgi:hypothetical protein